MHPKIISRKVEDAQSVLDRDVVDGALLIHDPVSQPHELTHEVFSSIAVAVLPRWEESPLAVAEDAVAKVDDLKEKVHAL